MAPELGQCLLRLFPADKDELGLIHFVNILGAEHVGGPGEPGLGDPGIHVFQCIALLAEVFFWQQEGRAEFGMGAQDIETPLGSGLTNGLI